MLIEIIRQNISQKLTVIISQLLENLNKLNDHLELYESKR